MKKLKQALAMFVAGGVYGGNAMAGDPIFSVSEPSVLGLVAAGVVVSILVTRRRR